jgi:5-methylcytosine-specific restriction protein B
MSETVAELQSVLENLRHISIDIFNAYENQHSLVEQMNRLPQDVRDHLHLAYLDSRGKVRDIRQEVTRILAARNITYDEVNAIITKAVVESPGSFNTMYKNWYNILYPILNAVTKDSVIRAFLDFRDIVGDAIGHKDKIKFVNFDFSGAIQTGSIIAWSAFYNNTHPKQNTAKQLFLQLENGIYFYALHDHKTGTSYPSGRFEPGEHVDLQKIIDLYKNNVQAILDDDFVEVKDDYLLLKPHENIFKASMSGKDINESAFNYFVEHSLVVVHRETSAKGVSYESQGEIFTDKMKVGDYVYICRGNNKLVAVGQITSEAVDCEYDDMGDQGWAQRHYKLIKESVVTGNYKGADKWWTPNNNSTCIPIKPQDYVLANDVLFKPYFKLIIEKQKPQKSDMSLNQILYGPPGTGKTYVTIDMAVKIIDSNSSTDHSINKARFDELRKQEQIEFITFHQNYSYEDFMVGLRPDIDQPKLQFTSFKGAFYQIAQKAKLNYLASKNSKPAARDFFEVLNEIFQPLEEDKEVEVIMASGISYHVTDFTSSTIYFRKSNKSTSHTLSIATLKEIVEGTRILNSGLVVYYNPLAKLIREKQESQSVFAEQLKNYVLIIDEINRANISKVFGELITLIEDDKRLGEKNELTVTLPNMITNFGVPPNLYILGTMNTADKSIALIDIALRRRFDFIGKYPDYQVLIDAHLIEEEKLLRSLNTAIYNKKHTADYLIGHAYFLNGNPIEHVLLKKIIPLLNEYFGNRINDVKEVFKDSGWLPHFSETTYQWSIAKKND